MFTGAPFLIIGPVQRVQQPRARALCLAAFNARKTETPDNGPLFYRLARVRSTSARLNGGPNQSCGFNAANARKNPLAEWPLQTISKPLAVSVALESSFNCLP